MTLQIRLLGGFEAVCDPGGPVEIPARKARALLALLARRPGKPQTRESLAAQLWPETAPERARGSLRQALKQLRRALGREAGALRSDGDAVVVDPAAEVDAEIFERLCAAGDPDALVRAGEIYLGAFLDGFTAPTEAVEEWIGFERSALHERAIGAVARLSEAGGGEPASAAMQMALRLLALDPLQEPLHRLLMQLYLAQGRRSDAAAQYRMCRDVLQRELGVAPDPETERLFRSLRDSAPRPAAEAGGPAVAVLPFRNLDAPNGHDYFSDGLTEDIITALTRWRGFPVISRHSSFALRAEDPGLGQAAQMLGARYVLVGSVRRAQQRIRVSVELSDADTGTGLWAERYDRKLTDIFAVQDEITRAVATTVAPEIARAEMTRGRAKPPEDLDAWDCVLRGMARIREGTAEGSAAARALFARALAIRPDYAEAHAGMAMAGKIDLLLGVAEDRAAVARAAMAAVRRAIALDPKSAVAHQELSTAYQFLGRSDEALAEIRIAVELNPYDAEGLHQLGNKSDLAGDPRGIGYMETAHRLNPLDTQTHLRLTFLARAHVNAGNFDRAEACARRAIRQQDDYPPSHYILALAQGGLGRLADGRAALARCDVLQPGFVAMRRGWAPYRNPESNARLRAALARVEDA